MFRWSRLYAPFISLVLVAPTLACSSEDDGKDDKDGTDDLLQGTWAILPDEYLCVIGVSFIRPQYEIDFICELNSGATGMQIELGSYSIDGRTLTFIPEQATCPGAEADTMSFAVTDDSLRLLRPSGALVLSRLEPQKPSNGLAVRFGCFDSDLVFTPSDLAPVD